MKKYLSILLALAMVVTAFAACGSAPSSGSSAAPTEEPASEAISVAEETDASQASAHSAEEPEESSLEEAEETDSAEQAEPAVSLSYPLDGENLELSMWVSVFIGSPYETHPVFVEAERQTGVHISFTETNPGAERDEFQLTIAAGDYPDIFRGLNNFYTGGASAAVEDEIIYDLAPYLAEYAPDYNALLHSDDYASFINDAYDDAGHMGCMYQLSSNPSYSSQGLMFRADWLDELGMDIPVTIEENHEYLTATKETYGCTNALYMNDEFQYTELANAYGVAGYSMSKVGSSGSHFYQVDGEARSSFNQEGFKKYLQTLNQWYNEEIINRDFMSNQSGTMTEFLYAATNDCGRYNQVMVY